jgi:hypothetical protein
MSAEELSWFKSSFSSGGGGECLETAYTWRKSTQGGPSTIHIRDSKNPTGPHLNLSPTAWADFLTHAGK